MQPTDYRTLIEPLAERARTDPQWPGLVLIHDDDRREVVTAAELHAAVERTARGLLAADIRSGDVVVLALGHSRDLVTTFLGAMRAGAVPAIFSSYVTEGLDPGSFQKRVAALTASSGAVAVIATAKHRERLSDGVAEQGCRVLTDDDICAAATQFTSIAPIPVADQTAFLQYTSGSGGTPKGIAHPHARVLRHIERMLQAESIRRHDVIVNWLPLYHDFGLVGGLLAPLVLGLRSVLISPQRWVRTPAILLRAIHEFRGTRCYMPNFALNHCVRGIRRSELDGLDLRSWDGLCCGAEPVRSDSMQRFSEHFAPLGFNPSAFSAGYGMAETVLGVAVSPHGAPPKVDWIDRQTLQREGRALQVESAAPGSMAVVSCGFPLPGTEVRIVGDDNSQLAERQCGEIAVRSDCMFDGYYRRPDLTSRALRRGWLRTGDLGYLAARELYITGRKTDLIIVSGHNVHPEDVEEMADGVPGVRPGRSVAFGIADADLGSERIVLLCEPAADDDADRNREIERRLRQRAVQELDIALGVVWVVPKGWIVKTSSGKHARPANRDKYLHELAPARAGRGQDS